jgi:hypothetical protein
MELIAMIGFFGLMGLGFSKALSSKSDYKSNITKIDDKNWIVNNEFVSFETDTPVLRFQQEMEDNKHFRAYEMDRLTRDRERIGSYWLKTIEAIRNHPEIKTCVTPEKLEDVTEKYNEYIQMCDNVDEMLRLTKEEFLIREENITLCVDFLSFASSIPNSGSGIYEISNPETARYYKGNMQDIMAEEFKKKHY